MPGAVSPARHSSVCSGVLGLLGVWLLHWESLSSAAQIVLSLRQNTAKGWDVSEVK